MYLGSTGQKPRTNENGKGDIYFVVEDQVTTKSLRADKLFGKVHDRRPTDYSRVESVVTDKLTKSLFTGGDYTFFVYVVLTRYRKEQKKKR